MDPKTEAEAGTSDHLDMLYAFWPAPEVWLEGSKLLCRLTQ